MPKRASRAIGAAVALTVLLAAVYAAIHAELVQRADVSILHGFIDLGDHPRIRSLAVDLTGLCDPDPYVYLCVIPIALALLRRRIWVALAIVGILLGANVTTELLKPLLDVQRSYSFPAAPGTGSWPSGHATAAMSLALCCVIAAPGRLRSATATLGALFAVAVSYSFLALAWHYPTDVLGGFLVASIWTLLGVAAIWTAHSHRAPQSAQAHRQGRPMIWAALGPPSAVLLAAVALVALVAIAQPHDVVSYARLHKAFMIGAGGIGALALALATGVMLALRR